MMLLTQKIINALPALYATEKIPLPNKTVICKFFTPDGSWTWYVFEGSQQANGDYLFFGIVIGYEAELGYFNYFELLKRRSGLGLPIERDQAVFKVPCYKLLSRRELAHFLSPEELKCLP